MMKLFLGMIVGSLITIYAAGGAAVADLIMHNMMTLVQDSSNHPQSLMVGLSVWSATAFSMVWMKRRQQRPKTSQYAFLLR
ncbi:hypothetical protein [Candidatus Nitronereus thalassa]|uniref:Uncharacterized protein n=1 Tax=Candidatus Nitronereus thalassa TaxID=3020898 RepID=A0ABU3KAG5_9BACT|nr:hypothetical protein [Candidatus Nitronereus thalassa]MDT7043445.1 hypothetical protein [Candidatus Nitronereus thalassa]